MTLRVVIIGHCVFNVNNRTTGISNIVNGLALGINKTRLVMSKVPSQQRVFRSK